MCAFLSLQHTRAWLVFHDLIGIFPIARARARPRARQRTLVGSHFYHHSQCWFYPCSCWLLLLFANYVLNSMCENCLAIERSDTDQHFAGPERFNHLSHVNCTQKLGLRFLARLVSFTPWPCISIVAVLQSSRLR
jgi:hypothetical protein